MAELVDARDSKSRGGNTVSVRVRPSAPLFLLAVSDAAISGERFMAEQVCIFCKIIAGNIPATIVKETEYVLVIKDIHPKAPTHLLILPKQHLINLTNVQDSHRDVMFATLTVTRKLAAELSIKSFNLVSNNGAGAGQSVFHFHWHFLSGRDLGEIAKEGM